MQTKVVKIDPQRVKNEMKEVENSSEKENW